MDVEELAVTVHLYRKYVKRKNKYWVHPLRSERLLKGHFSTFYADLRNYDDEFFNYTRMSVKSFDELLAKLSDKISGKDTTFRRCICNEEKLLVTLRYLASGKSFTDMHHHCRLGVTTIREIVRSVCSAIWEVLKQECLPEPTQEDWMNIAKEFESRANFPNCLGAVDGKHIRLVKPPNSASLYFNYKKFFSLVLMAVTDANYKFIYIDVGAYGKCSDSAIFGDSAFYKKVNSDTMNLPSDEAISYLNPVPLPFVFLADDAFALSRRVMCPYVGKTLSVEKRTFNYRHCRGRRFVECTFGILANKWRIFHRALDVDIDFAIDIVKTCCIIHNFVRDRDGVKFKDTLYRFSNFHEEDLPPIPNRRNYESHVRNAFAKYFMNEGAVTWQNDFI